MPLDITVEKPWQMGSNSVGWVVTEDGLKKGLK